MNDLQQLWKKVKRGLEWEYLDGIMVCCYASNYVSKERRFMPVGIEYEVWYEEMEELYGEGS